jgi:pilus assembly protein CpaE
MTLKVSAIFESKQMLDGMAASIAVLPQIQFTAHKGAFEQLTDVLQSDKPDVVILEFPNADEKAIAQVELALQGGHETHLILVSPDRSVEFLMRAMRAGVRQVLPTPLEFASVQQALQHARGNQAKAARAEKQSGLVIGMVGSKGGAGSTFLATNLAYALSRQGKRVAVIDLNLYFGDAVVFLGDSKPTSNVVDLARKSEGLDAVLLDSSMIKLGERLHILVAPESPEYVKYVSPSDIERIIRLARTCYDVVVIDASALLDPLTVQALDMADIIYLSLQLNLPFVRAAKRMVEEFRGLGYSNEKIRVVINRFEKGGEIKLEDVEKATLLKVNRTIPNSHGPVTDSINQGIPLLELVPRDAVSHALQEWAHELAPTSQPVEAGWWHGIKRSLS